MSAALKVELVTDDVRLEALEGEWTKLLERSVTDEVTLSPTWLLAWWRVFGPLDGRVLRVAAFFDGPRLVGLAPLLLRRHRYRSAIPFRRLELLGSGEPEADEIGSDYLSIVAERGAEQAVAAAFADALAQGTFGAWDELSLDALNGHGAFPVLLGQALRAQGWQVRSEVLNASFHVPLPSTWEAYLEALPSTRRYMVRRSLRDFESWAKEDARLVHATTREDLEKGKEILIKLHGDRWAHAGKPGVFSSRRFREFHDAVMPKLFEAGALDLVSLVVRGEPLSIAYNLLWRGKVQFYQSGRAVEVPKGIRPGIVIHAYAIRDAIAAGFKEYDFLPGTSRYKMTLGLSARPILRMRAVRPSAVETARRATELVIDQLRSIRASVRGPVAKPAPEAA